MTKELMQCLRMACENEGIEVSEREDYSGRGMYGEETCGIVVDNPADVILACADNPDCFLGIIFENDTSLSMDSMGMKTIIY